MSNNGHETPQIPRWRKLAWDLGWWLPFLPARLRRKLFRMIGE